MESKYITVNVRRPAPKANEFPTIRAILRVLGGIGFAALLCGVAHAEHADLTSGAVTAAAGLALFTLCVWAEGRLPR